MRLKLPKNKKKLTKITYAFLGAAKSSRVDRLNFKESFARQVDKSITIYDAVADVLDGRKFNVRLVKRNWSFEPPYWELSFDYSIDAETDRFIWIDVSLEQCEIFKSHYGLKEETFD